MKKANILLEQLERLDTLYRTTGILTDLEQEIRAALEACKKYGVPKGIAYYTYYIARLHEYNREMEIALELTIQAKELATQENLVSLRIDCLASEANLHLWHNRLKDAFRIASDTLAEAEKIENHFAIAYCNYILGSVCERYGSDDEALKYFQKALEISRKDKFLKMEGTIQDKLAQFFLNRHQFRLAERNARAVANIQHRLKNQRNILRSQLQLATIFLESNRHTEAAEFLSIVRQNESFLPVSEKATLTLCEGKIEQRKKNFSKAEDLYNKALKIFSKNDRKILIANVYFLLAEAQLERKNYAESIVNAKHILKLIEPGTHNFLELQAYRLIYEASKLIGNSADALKYLELHNEKFADQQKQLLESRIQLIELQGEYQMKQAEITTERQNAEELRIELVQKERELTEKTRHLIKQTESLAQFRDDLRAIIRRSPMNDPLIQEIKERLSQKTETQFQWQDFDKEFKSVHPDFDKKLRMKHPILTKMENKICSMLSLGLTSVDIAKLLALSDRNIENHRYRIRKKLALNTEKSLHEYLGAI